MENNKVFVGEFNEDEVLRNGKWYTERLQEKINDTGLTNVITRLVEYKGISYYFRKMKVYLTN